MSNPGEKLVKPCLTLGGAVPLRHSNCHHSAGSGWVWLESQTRVLNEHHGNSYNPRD